MTARRHHFVPQGYLEGFAADSKRPQLHVVDLVRRKTYPPTSAKNIAVRRDFNRIDIEGRAIDELEAMLAGIESDVIAAIRRINDARTLANQDDLHMVLNLLGLLFARNPQFRHTIEEGMRKVVQGIANLSVQSPEIYANSAGRFGSSDYDEMKAFVEGGDYKIKINRTWMISQELSVVVPVIEMLGRRKWSLFMTDPANTGGFVTSDHPACLFWTKPMPKGPFFSPGLGLKPTVILFPLNRHMCIEGRFEPTSEEVQLDFKQVARVNGAIVSAADECVFAADDKFVFMAEGASEPTMGVDLLSFLKRP